MPRNNRTGRPRDHGIAAATPPRRETPARRPDTAPAGHRGEVRIIGGAWRGRKLQFPSAETLRPTPDRVRETLFNWLQFDVPGRRCLDLFAGSGALGFEALSRGAAEVVFVERDPRVAAAIGAALRVLRCDRGQVATQDAFTYLRQAVPRPFDLVFLDPPYDERWLERACTTLESGGWLAPGAWVYLEDTAARGAPTLPEGWTLLRSRKAGDVGYHLARRGGVPEPTSTPNR